MSLFKNPKVEEVNNNSEQTGDGSVEPAKPAELTAVATRVHEIWTMVSEGKKFKDYDASSDGMFVTLIQKQGRTPATWDEIKIYQDYDGTWTTAFNRIRPGLETEPFQSLLRQTTLFPVSVESPVVTGIEENLRLHDDGSLELVQVINTGTEIGVLNETQCQNLVESLKRITPAE